MLHGKNVKTEGIKYLTLK